MTDKVVAQGSNDLKTLSVTRFCTVDEKYCEDKLTIDIDNKISFEDCGQKQKLVTVNKSLLDNVSKINKDKVRFWAETTHVDTVCGYLIKFDESDKDFVYFDSDPSLYDDQEIKDIVVTLNELFKAIG